MKIKKAIRILKKKGWKAHRMGKDCYAIKKADMWSIGVKKEYVKKMAKGLKNG